MNWPPPIGRQFCTKLRSTRIPDLEENVCSRDYLSDGLVEFRRQQMIAGRADRPVSSDAGAVQDQPKFTNLNLVVL